MKIGLLILGVLFFLKAGAQVQEKTPNFTLKGESDFFFELAHLPTSVQGQTRFDFALLRLSPEFRIDDQLALNFEFVLAEERSSTKKNYLNEMQNAFIQYKDSKFLNWTHEIGLIKNYWIRNQGSAGEFIFFGDTSKSLSLRNRLLSEGDLGYQGILKINDDVQWAFGFVNGEENKSDEIGPNKESFLGLFLKKNNHQLNFWLSSGRVDRLDSKINEKNRFLMRYEWLTGRFLFAIEGFYAKDPSLDLETESRFEGITFSELAVPRSIESTGGRLDLGYDLNDQQRLLVRFDQIVPQKINKEIQSMELAWIKRETQHLVWGAFLEKTDFGTRHSSQSKTHERARLGLQVTF